METVRKTRKLPEQVADKLREMIIQESLKTGAKLPAEAELMERFGVSRSTVREAVKILQTEHIVDIRQGQGTFLCAMPGLASDPLGRRSGGADRPAAGDAAADRAERRGAGRRPAAGKAACRDEDPAG